MSSMLYTVGLALDRAAQNGHDVEVLVDGHWLCGKVAAMDGTGVVLESSEGNHAVAKVERIGAVRIMSQSPYKASISAGLDDDEDAEARPMPGPQEFKAS